MPDILQPYRSSVAFRNEIILVEYEGFIVNQSANIICAMLTDVVKYAERYPKIQLFFDMNARMIYESTKLYDPIELLIELMEVDLDSMSEEDSILLAAQIQKDLQELDTIDVSQYVITTMFSYALNRIVSDKSCSKAYIIKNGTYHPWQINHMRKIFENLKDKIEYIEGDFFDFYMEEKDNLTTIFLNHTEDLLKIYGLPEHETFSEKQLFAIKTSNDIVEEDPNIHKYVYTQLSLFEELEKSHIHISTIGCEVFDETEGVNDRPICTG